MHLLVDIGNTSIGVVFKDKEQLKEKFALTCEKGKTIDEYVALFEALFGVYKNVYVEYIVYSSVVPIVLQIVTKALKRLYPDATEITVKPGVKTGVLFKIDNMSELGADLVCDSVALKNKYVRDVIGVDLGTATKFILINEKGEFEGCSIAPGLVQAVRSLCLEASLLHEVDISLPDNIIGKNTNDSIKSGSILSHALMIEATCDAYEREIGHKLKRVITGGYSIPLKEYFINHGFIYDENLIFDGLEEIFKKNRSLKNEK